MGGNCCHDSDDDAFYDEGEGFDAEIVPANTHEDDQVITEGLNYNEPTDGDDIFKPYAEIAQQENERRSTLIDSSTDIFARTDIKLLPNVESNFGRIDNEESGEYIITYWCRGFEEPLFMQMPLVLCDLIVKFIDMVYRSRWSNKCKGPDFKLNILDKCKATMRMKYAYAMNMKQAIRAVNCCLRGKVSVFYINFKNISKKRVRASAFTVTDINASNFIGIVTEYEDTFNIPLPKEGYGIVWEQNKIYKCNESIKRKGKPLITLNKKVKCVVDLREGKYIFKCLWASGETVIMLPNAQYNTEYKDIKWYPYISGNFNNMMCVIEFEEFTANSDAYKIKGPGPPPPPLPLPPSLPF